MVIQHGVFGICVALHWLFGFGICMSIAWVLVLFLQYGYGLRFAVVLFCFICFLFLLYLKIEAVNQISVKTHYDFQVL
jgi:hypothetical protein